MCVHYCNLPICSFFRDSPAHITHMCCWIYAQSRSLREFTICSFVTPQPISVHYWLDSIFCIYIIHAYIHTYMHTWVWDLHVRARLDWLDPILYIQ